MKNPNPQAQDKGPDHHHQHPVTLDLTVAGERFSFEGPYFMDASLGIFRAWLQAVGPTRETQALIDEVTEKLKASNDAEVETVAANTPTA